MEHLFLFATLPSALQMLLDQLDKDLSYSLCHEAHWKGGSDDCVNYQTVRAEIASKLEALSKEPNRYVSVSCSIDRAQGHELGDERYES